MSLQNVKALAHQRGQAPVHQHGRQIDFHPVGPEVLGNNQIGFPQHINQTDGIGQRPFLHQIDQGIAKVGQGYHRRLGQHYLAKSLEGRQPNADSSFILPFGDGLIGCPEHFRNVGPKQQGKGNDGVDRPVHLVQVQVRKSFCQLGQPIENNEQENNGRGAAHDIGVPMGQPFKQPVVTQLGLGQHHSKNRSEEHTGKSHQQSYG